MAQPGDLARVGDDHVGVDDSRVVLRVSTVIETTLQNADWRAL